MPGARCNFPGAKPQAPSNKLDKTSQIIYDGDIMNVRKKLVKEIKKTNPVLADEIKYCLLYTSPSPRDVEESRMPSSA